MAGTAHRPRLLVEADILDARECQMAHDLAGNQDGVTKQTERLNTLLDEYLAIPLQRTAP